MGRQRAGAVSDGAALAAAVTAAGESCRGYSRLSNNQFSGTYNCIQLAVNDRYDLDDVLWEAGTRSGFPADCALRGERCRSRLRLPFLELCRRPPGWSP